MDKNTFNILSICSGVGGLELGLELAIKNVRTICYVEGEAYCCEILAKRMEEKQLVEAPIWSDIKTFDGKPWRGKVDCIVGGYPCQPFSIAGKRLAEKDPRHLWPDVARLIREVRPPICFFENVGGHLRLGFESVAKDLQAMGYRVKAGLFTAVEIGAPHKRERLFILAYNDKLRCDNGGNHFFKRHLCENTKRSISQNQFKGRKSKSRFRKICESLANSCEIIKQRCFYERSSKRKQEKETSKRSDNVANTASARTSLNERELWKKRKRNCPKKQLENSKRKRCGRWGNGMEAGKIRKIKTTRSQRSLFKEDELPIWPPKPEDFNGWRKIPTHLKPAVLRMDNGLANRVDRIRACGNGVVPLVCAYAWRTLTDGLHLGKVKKGTNE